MRVLELADVAGPGVVEERAHRVRRPARAAAAPRRSACFSTRCSTRSGMSSRRSRSGGSRSGTTRSRNQRSSRNFPSFTRAREVLVRRRDDPHVRLARLAAADRDVLAVLQDAEELRLERGREEPELVEEERPALGLREEARPRLLGAGERALLVPEQLRLGEVLRDGAHVERDVRARRAPATCACAARASEVLAGAGLALDEDRHVGRRDRARASPRASFIGWDLPMIPCTPNSPGERAPQPRVLALHARVLDGARDDDLELLRLERLLEVVERARLHRLDRGLDGGERGDEDDRDLRDLRLEAAQPLEPVDARHAQVGDDRVELGALDRGQRLRHRGEVEDLVASARACASSSARAESRSSITIKLAASSRSPRLPAACACRVTVGPRLARAPPARRAAGCGTSRRARARSRPRPSRRAPPPPAARWRGRGRCPFAFVVKNGSNTCAATSGAHARAGVRDLDHDAASPSRRARATSAPPPRSLHRLHRVHAEVQERLAEELGVGDDVRQVGLDLDRAARPSPARRPGPPPRPPRAGSARRGCAMRVDGAGAREHEEALDERRRRASTSRRIASTSRLHARRRGGSSRAATEA